LFPYALNQNILLNDMMPSAMPLYLNSKFYNYAESHSQSWL